MRRPFVRPTLRSRLTLSLVSSLALVATLFVWSAPGADVASAATPACTTANLDVWLNTEGSGAAGSSYYALNFTNLSGRTCTLDGYPGVSAITQAGIQLGSAAARDNTHAATLITLTSASSAAGLEATAHSTASVIVQITVAENFPTATCHPVTSAGLRVYPPGQKESTVVPYPFVACQKAGPRFLHVEATQHFISSP